jgi:hypothetical protein
MIFPGPAHVFAPVGVNLRKDNFHPGGIPFMKLGFKTIVLALAVALLCVPAAFAKNGNGHGKPSWAGGGGGGNGHGKPAWAGQGKGHADKAKVKHEKKAKHQKAGSDAPDAAAAEDDGEVNLDDLNPSWYCKTLEAMMDATDADAVAGGAESGEFSSFDAEFGTNDNKRNSHGKCVSRRAHGDDLSGAVEGDQAEPACEPAADEAEGDEGTTTDEATTTDDATTTDEGTTTEEEPAVEEGSDEDVTDAEECESDAPAGDAAAEGDQGEDSDAQGDEGDQADDAGAAAFARALVRFIEL